MQARKVSDAYAPLVLRYTPRLRRYLVRLMPGLGEEVEDVLQNVFLMAYVNSASFDARLSFSSWIYRIAHNEAVSWLRKKSARVPTVELGEDDCATFSTSMELALDARAAALTRDAVARTLAVLDERHRSILVLRYLEGKSYEEISDILALPPGTVATRIRRAKEAFISIYESHHAR